MNDQVKDDIARDFLENNIDEIKRSYNPSEMWLFGSRATGKTKKDSDLDFIMVSDAFEGVKFIKRMGMVLKKVDFPIHADFICYTPEEFEKKKGQITIIREALKEGIRIL
ncbi:MAG: nucleotidyltransferase domain-containing protein [bacterium]